MSTELLMLIILIAGLLLATFGNILKHIYIDRFYNNGICKKCGNILTKEEVNKQHTKYVCYRCGYKVLLTYKISDIEVLK